MEAGELWNPLHGDITDCLAIRSDPFKHGRLGGDEERGEGIIDGWRGGGRDGGENRLKERGGIYVEWEQDYIF